jgi:hypothetical protein
MILLLCAALLGPSPPIFEHWSYPQANYTLHGIGHAGTGDYYHETCNFIGSTGDDLAVVVEHFRQKSGDADILDGSHGPLALKILARQWEGAAATAVISRAEGETRTHFVLASHRAGPLYEPRPFHVDGIHYDPPPDRFNLRDWTYPGAKVVEEETDRPARVWSRTTARDDYASILKFYQDRTGAIWVDGTPLKNGTMSDVCVANGAEGRPLKLHVLTRWWKQTSVTVVLSRAQDEEETYIDLIYCKSP